MNTTFLILIAVIALAVALGGVIAFLYARARQSEQEVATAPQPESKKDLLRQKEEQVTKIRQRIEELYHQQQQEQRVQHAQLSQQMDDVKLHLETNDRKVDGLRGELHHEIERRNQELDELRHQLAGALDAFWKTHDALPEGQSAGPKMLAASNESPAPQASQSASAPPPSTAQAAPPPSAPAAPPSPAAPSRPAATSTPAPSTPAPSNGSGDGAPANDSGLQWQSFDFAADFSDTPEPEPTPSGDSASTPLPTFASFDSLADFSSAPPPAEAPPPTAAAEPTPAPAPTPKPAPEPAPTLEPEAARPPGADVLTVISGIDDDIEQQLYAIDVTKLDQIARWSRTEARRVAQELGLRPQVVMDQWVFEAQSVLFDQYQQLI